MQEWMRKHRKVIMFFIFIFIGIPMVTFLGMPSFVGGGRNQQTNADTVIAKVGNVPILESEFRQRLDSLATQRAQSGERPSYRELDEDGTATRALEQLTDAALIKIQEQQRDFTVNRELLVKQMQKFPMFENEDGNFDHEKWNEWVQSIDKSRWDEIYADLQETVTRQVFLGTITASANRILSQKIEEELLADQTTLKFKHAKVELQITPTDEEIQTQYEENQDAFREPEVNQAEFVAVSLIPDVPEIAIELVERARNGEDFAVLADEYSDVKEPEGGAMGWRRAGDYVSPHLKPFFALEWNEVSDPVLGPNGYIIYKIEEERKHDLTGEREINGRQIILNTELSEEVRNERIQLANEIAAKLKETDDLQAVADEYGLEALKTDYFNRMNLEIENIHHEDIYTFRGKILAETAVPWEPIEAKRHIYLAKIVDTKPGDLPPLEEIRDKVIENIKNERKRTDEYQERLEEKIDLIKDRVDNLATITDLDSDISVEIGEVEEAVSRKDSLFQQKIYVQTTAIFDALEEKEVGEVGGPIRGFLGAYWFFELLERNAPTEEELAAMEDERQEIKDRIIQTAQYETLSDYTKDLRERMLASVPFTQDMEALDRILGRNQEEETEEPAPADTTGVEGEFAPTGADSSEAEDPDSDSEEAVVDTAATTPESSEEEGAETPAETPATDADIATPESEAVDSEPTTVEVDSAIEITAPSMEAPSKEETQEPETVGETTEQ